MLVSLLNGLITDAILHCVHAATVLMTIQCPLPIIYVTLSSEVINPCSGHISRRTYISEALASCGVKDTTIPEATGQVISTEMTTNADVKQ